MKNKKFEKIVKFAICSYFLIRLMIFCLVEYLYSPLNELEKSIKNVDSYYKCNIVIFDYNEDEAIHYNYKYDKVIMDELFNEILNIGDKRSEPTFDRDEWLKSYLIYFYTNESYTKYEITVYDGFIEVENNIKIDSFLFPMPYYSYYHLK